MTKKKTSFPYVTYVRTTPEKVFEAITKPDILETGSGVDLSARPKAA